MYQTKAQAKIKLAIFDLDGTLLNTIEDLGRACNYALAVCGCHTREMSEYQTLVGRGIYNLFRGALPPEARSEEMVRKMADVFIPYYTEHKADFTRPYDGITQMLDRVKNGGIALAVASNKYQEGAESLVDKFFEQRNFLKILGQREGLPIKPDPEIVWEIGRAWKETFGREILSDEILYVGDSDVDMETGKNAGVHTVGVTWGFRSREELAAGEPEKLCDSPEELAEYILSL